MIVYTVFDEREPKDTVEIYNTVNRAYQVLQFHYARLTRHNYICDIKELGGKDLQMIVTDKDYNLITTYYLLEKEVL